MRSKAVYPDAPFPVERLVVSHGTLSGSAHRNGASPIHLDWDFYIVFKPLDVSRETYETAMHIQIETRDVRRLEGLSGMTRHDTDGDFNIGSFYLSDHRTSRDTHFCVHSVRGRKLDIEVSVKVDVGDSYIDRRPPLRTVHVRTELMFEKILVSSYGVQCGADEAQLMKLANELFDTSAFAPPTKSSDEYQGKPILNLTFGPLG